MIFTWLLYLMSHNSPAIIKLSSFSLWLVMIHRKGQAKSNRCDVSFGGTDRWWSGHCRRGPPGVVFLSRQMQGRPEPSKVSEGVCITSNDTWIICSLSI